MVWSAFALLGLAAPAEAVRVTDVRVGQHDDYTRIVFDLDAPAGYRLERNEAGKTTEVLVRFDAGAQPKVVRSLSPLVEEVKLESRPEGAVARIVLRSRDVRLVDQVLSGPSRVVIDVRRGGGESSAPAKPPADAKTAPAKPAATPPEPKQAAARPAPTETRTAAEPKPAAAATASVPESRVNAPPPASAPVPAPSAAPAPGAAPGGDTVAEIEAQADAAAARLLGEEKPRPKLAQDTPSLGPPTLATSPPAGAEPAAPGAPPVVAEAPLPTGPDARPGDSPVGPDAPAIPAPPKPTGPPLQMAKPPPGAIATQPGGPPPGARPASDTSAYQNWIYGGLFLFALFLIVALWRRRDRTEDVHTGALPVDAFEDRAATFGDSDETVAMRSPGAEPLAETVQMPVPTDFAGSSDRTVEIPLPAGAGSAGRDPLALAGRPQSSLFDDEGGAADAAEEKEIDELDVGRGAGVFGDRPDVGGFAPGLRSDDAVLRTLRDIEGRLAEIEGRLAREADARERVERQVVAQTEELRVQRAAIARTQRVLRTLSRPDDLATEPVIRSPGPGGGSSGGGGSGSI
jgi:hypothetical protein